MKKIITMLALFGFIGCAQDNVIELEGKIAMKGSSPHSYLSIKDSKSHKSYKIKNEVKFNLSKKQNQTVKIKAVLIKESIGPGYPALIEVVEVK